MERQTQILKATEREEKIQTHAHRRETKGQMKDLDHMNFKNTSSKSDRERQIPYDIAYMWNLKKKNGTNELIYKTKIVTDVENKLIVIKGKMR